MTDIVAPIRPTHERRGRIAHLRRTPRRALLLVTGTSAAIWTGLAAAALVTTPS